MYLNGYDVSKNEATRGRLYRVRNAAGKTVRECLNIGHAIKVAESLPPGDVPDPDLPPSRQPIPVTSPPTPEPLKEGEPLPDRWPPKTELPNLGDPLPDHLRPTPEPPPAPPAPVLPAEPVAVVPSPKARPKKKTSKRKRGK